MSSFTRCSLNVTMSVPRLTLTVTELPPETPWTTIFPLPSIAYGAVISLVSIFVIEFGSDFHGHGNACIVKISFKLNYNKYANDFKNNINQHLFKFYFF